MLARISGCFRLVMLYSALLYRILNELLTYLSHFCRHEVGFICIMVTYLLVSYYRRQVVLNLGVLVD